MMGRRPSRARSTSITSPRTGERASAAVEFALVLPLVLVMALALVQVGLLVKDQLVLLGSARAGAREAAVDTNDDAVRQVSLDVASAGGLDPSAVEVSVSREGGVGTAVAVTVAYHAPVVVPLVEWLFPASVDLSGETTMRQETG
jgi:Flp pilus assembly protein TadG